MEAQQHGAPLLVLAEARRPQEGPVGRGGRDDCVPTPLRDDDLTDLDASPTNSPSHGDYRGARAAAADWPETAAEEDWGADAWSEA